MSEGETNKILDYSELIKILKDFIKDLLITFHDKLVDNLDDNLRIIVTDEDNENNAISNIYEYCKSVYPERFFDILYQNKKIFDNPDINTKFLPGIEFKELWIEELTDKTRDTIWKYLQLILFFIISNIEDDNNTFGDAGKLFETINQDAFKNKLQDTMKQMESLFSQNEETDENGEPKDLSNTNFNFPDADEVHNHINKLMEGKLGKLARELAEDTAASLDINTEDVASVDDVFKKLIGNPNQLMDIVKNVGSKLEEKMKSGEIKESELLEEASDLMNNMKNMPGMDNIEEIMGKMGNLGNMKNKFNNAGFQDVIKKNMKTAKTKERMRAKLSENNEKVNQLRQDSVDEQPNLETLNNNLQSLLESFNIDPQELEINNSNNNNNTNNNTNKNSDKRPNKKKNKKTKK